jgi:peptidoglycan/LPS O-acetylase OafA/YrhL
MEKERLHTLNALRTVATACVVADHLRLWFPDVRVMAHAYLAVDFFFLLSGFVLAHAYERKLQEGLKVSSFLAIRAIRLYPLIVIASCIGLANQFLRPLFLPTADVSASLGWWFVLSVLSIPIVEGAGSAGQFFPLNWPAWSMFFEIALSAVFALVLFWSRKLIALVAAFGIALALVAMYRGRIDLGRDSMFFIAGIPRAAFPFFCGILLYRYCSTWKFQNFSISPFLCCAILFLTLLPSIPRGNWNAAYDLLCVGVLYPALVLMASHVKPGPLLSKVARFGGELSYALYILHFPLLAMFVYLMRIGGVPIGYTSAWLVAGALGFMLMGVWLIGTFLDKPLRRYFMETLQLRTQTIRAGSAASQNRS